VSHARLRPFTHAALLHGNGLKSLNLRQRYSTRKSPRRIRAPLKTRLGYGCAAWWASEQVIKSN